MGLFDSFGTAGLSDIKSPGGAGSFFTGGLSGGFFDWWDSDKPGNSHNAATGATPFGAGYEDLVDFQHTSGQATNAYELLNDATIYKDGRVITTGGLDVTDIASKFNAWKKEKESNRQDWATYVEKSKRSPGRDQTLLGADSPTVLGKQADFGTVLGAQPSDVNAKKTVLG